MTKSIYLYVLKFECGIDILILNPNNVILGKCKSNKIIIMRYPSISKRHFTKILQHVLVIKAVSVELTITFCVHCVLKLKRVKYFFTITSALAFYLEQKMALLV